MTDKLDENSNENCRLCWDHDPSSVSSHLTPGSASRTLHVCDSWVDPEISLTAKHVLRSLLTDSDTHNRYKTAMRTYPSVLRPDTWWRYVTVLWSAELDCFSSAWSATESRFLNSKLAYWRPFPAVNERLTKTGVELLRSESSSSIIICSEFLAVIKSITCDWPEILLSSHVHNGRHTRYI